MKSVTLIAGCGIALVGCSTVGPDYQPPDMVLQSQFDASSFQALADSRAQAWWQQLDDPLLNDLVGRGAGQNLDIQAALARIRAANASVGRSGVNAQTTGALTGSVIRDRSEGVTDTTSAVAVDAGFVFDMFGGIGRGREQALANVDAAQFDAGAVRLAFMSDLANSYIQARYFQEAAAITRQTIESRRRTQSLVQQRRDIAEATDLELQQARSILAVAEASLPVQVANFEANVFHIATLLAEPAGPILARMQTGARQPRPLGRTNVGLPADLLRNRPDVLSAERNLAAATAAIGVAEAQLYPSLRLSGTLGTSTEDAWAFGPALSIPVLNRGLLRANRDVARATAEEAEIVWRKTVLVAVEDVQTALTLCRNWLRQVNALDRATASSQRLLDLSRDAYAAGEITLSDVLDAERQHSANRQALAEAVRSYAISWMRVQVAVGKGWGVPPMPFPEETAVAQAVADPLGLN